jgi:transcriptional regulator with XRE-family HTH domain
MTQTDLAKALDVTPQAVGQWLGGHARPSLERMVQLRDLYDIPLAAWTEEASP